MAHPLSPQLLGSLVGVLKLAWRVTARVRGNEDLRGLVKRLLGPDSSPTHLHSLFTPGPSSLTSLIHQSPGSVPPSHHPRGVGHGHTPTSLSSLSTCNLMCHARVYHLFKEVLPDRLCPGTVPLLSSISPSASADLPGSCMSVH